METQELTFTDAFIRYVREKLIKDSLPKIQRCLELLSEGDIWWKAHETNNSVGNLVLHLCGNVRQWIVSGVGGAKDIRERSKEFSTRGPIPKQELLHQLEQTLQEADRVLSSLDPSHLLEEKIIQGFRETCFSAIFHVVEHLSYHTGQIIYVTKLWRGIDLKFYNL